MLVNKLVFAGVVLLTRALIFLITFLGNRPFLSEKIVPGDLWEKPSVSPAVADSVAVVNVVCCCCYS